MKKRVFLSIGGMLFFLSVLFAQDVPVGVAMAFKQGNSQELNKYLGNKIDLNILGQSSVVDKQTAQARFAAFFTENKVSGFTVNHQGKRDESSFMIGTLATDKGAFRVNCFLKRIENKYLIHQIRIDKTNE
ncbi:DUF4783 domain-containing protein [uncultured Bacteroides sp.]|uniref:DUF4783 domain-containing protein n=1 Tax=uncultured Bacteroides sp. TaxID=162156 RepID=UPI002AA71ED1|nr:DUF4783 domain-containing protein [uncultured Bacteroides sp.]